MEIRPDGVAIAEPRHELERRSAIEGAAVDRRQRFLLASGAVAFLSGILVITLGATTWPGWLLIAAGGAAAIMARSSN